MKTLYVSDLDGTLLNHKKQLTEKSAEIINDCMKRGLDFTIATARMPYGCDYRLKQLDLTLPGIVANGVFLYDFKKKSYCVTEVISAQSAAKVLEVFRRFNTSCFVYSYAEGQLNLYYEKEELRSQTQYYSEQALKSCGEVLLVKDSMEKTAGHKIVYMTYTGAQEESISMMQELDKIEGIAPVSYLNVYNGLYCIEIFHKAVSKKAALLKLKEMLGYDELVVFGDNYNDQSMFDIADRKYAPDNAVPELKAIADEVIPGCDEDGVALFLEKEIRCQSTQMGASLKQNNYFHRVAQQTATSFWINNVTREEAENAIAEGAAGCTQNPSYVWKMLTDESEGSYAKKILKDIMLKTPDASNDDIQVALQRELVKGIAQIFKPLYHSSNGKSGYVSIQGNPFKEDADAIIEYAEYNYEAGENIMCKIPVTKEGLRAIAYLASKGIPINATEVMSVRQALDVCEIYESATGGMKKRAPIYFSHITGIYDEYLAKTAKENAIPVSQDVLWQAGMAVAKKIYQLVQDKKYPVGFIGGGARGLHHFTEMVGANASITINWKGTADKLIESNPPVVQRFFTPVPAAVLDELTEKMEDFRKAYESNGLSQEEYEDFGPVVLFRESFEKAWGDANAYIEKCK